MSNSTTPRQASESQDSGAYRWVLLVFCGLLLARLLGVYNLYFLEEDEISLAAGIAALVRDNVGDLYRYTPQLGYHRILEWITLLTGGDAASIPWLMKLWSVVVGALVPALGLLLFRDSLSLRERWLVVLALAVNPILWRSSQYGNSAMGSLGFVVVGMVLLSNRGGAWHRVAGLASFALAVFVRADAITMAPLFGFLLFRQVGSWRRLSAWVGGFGLVAGAMAALVLVLDPRLDNAAAAVATHMFGHGGRTQFWEFLLWAISPLALVFAVLGLRAMSESRAWLSAVVLLGALGPMAFYFRSTTTPRYFLLAVVPLAIAVALGMDDTIERLRERLGARFAWLSVLALGAGHLFVGLGQFPADQPRGIVTDAGFMTHDGFMPAGALLYDTYLRNGFLRQSFRNEGFGNMTRGNWEGVTFPRALAELSGRSGAQTVVLLFDAGWDHAFHFHAQAAGATYVSREPGDASAPFASETWLTVGDVSVMTIRYGGPDYARLQRLQVEAGDEVWITGRAEFPDEMTLAKLRPGLRLRRVEPFDDRIRVFRVERAID